MLNIAQIGVGYWGPNLLRNIVSSKRCQVSKVVELSKDRRDYVRSLYPRIEVVDNVSLVVEDPHIDAIIIVTPVFSHFDLAMTALNAGKHILVEKPMARTVSEVDAIAEIARNNKLVAMVGHTFLYNAAVRYVKKLIDAGDLGDIRYIYSQRLNLGRIRTDVDALWNLAPHDISIIQYWLGDPTPVSVVKRGIDYIQNGVSDVVFMNIIYPNKVMANIHVSWLDPGKVRSMTIVGSRKMVVYDDVSDTKVAIYDKGIDQRAVLGEKMDYDNQAYPAFSLRSGDVLLPKIDFQEPLKVEVNHFFDCIEKGVSCMTGVEHARKVVEILAS